MNVMDLPRYQYAGVNEAGVPVSGEILTPDLVKTTAKKHTAGWPELSITLDGVEVAGIATDQGERVWWAEA